MRRAPRPTSPTAAAATRATRRRPPSRCRERLRLLRRAPRFGVVRREERVDHRPEALARGARDDGADVAAGEMDVLLHLRAGELDEGGRGLLRDDVVVLERDHLERARDVLE